MKQKQTCPRCKRLARLTEHHCLPKHVFGGEGEKVLICRNCHDELEAEIKKLEKILLSKYAGAYINLARRFIYGAS